MKTARKKVSVTRSQNTSIPKPFSPIPTLYRHGDKDTLVWNVLGEEGLADALGSEWEKVEPKGPSECQKYQIKYSIIGGPDNHCFEVRVDGARAHEHDI